MKVFLLDLLHDLRAKRLWPVALVLAIGLVAVPVVLRKPAEQPPAPAPVAAEQGDEQNLKGLAKVVLAEQQEGKGSKLNLFEVGNPFSPPDSKKKKAAATDDTGAPATNTTGDTGGGTTSVGESVGGSVGGSTGGGTTSPTPPVTVPPKVTKFTYVIDVTFQSGDRKPRKIKGMQRLEMLPNENAPLLVFLGVDANARNAVFLVDSRLDPAGQGRCKPSRDECSFLYMRPGAEQILTDPEGNTYTLKVRDIRRVVLKDDATNKDDKAKAGSNDRPAKKSQYNRKTASEQHRPFLPRLLTDLVSVSDNPSSAAGKNR